MASPFGSDPSTSSQLYAAGRYVCFALTCLVGPGVGLQRAVLPVVEPALIVPTGIAYCAFAYWLSHRLGLPALFPALVALAWLPLFRRLQQTRRIERAPFRVVAPAWLALFAVLALTQYPGNRIAGDGRFVPDPLVPWDTGFHVGLVHELTRNGITQMPGLAGIPLGYHIGTDLVRAASLRYFDVAPFDSISRFDVTLTALAFALSLTVLAQRLGLPPLAVKLAPWTLLFADFSFLLGTNPNAHWWTDLLRGNILLSLVYANPVIPALLLACGALIALSHVDEAASPRWGMAAAAQAAAAAYFKVFVGAQLAFGLLVSAALSRGKGRFWAAASGLAAGIATASLAVGAGGNTLAVAFAPWDLVWTTRAQLALPTASRLGFVAWAALWIVLSLGVRLLGVPHALRALSAGTVTTVCAALMALCGWPTGLFFRVAAATSFDGSRPINDAAFFLEQSGPFLWLFALPAMAAVGAGPRGRKALLASILAALVLPGTAQYVVKKRGEPPDPLPSEVVRASIRLGQMSAPGDVVLTRPGARYPPAPLILAGRRVVFERFTPYLTQFADQHTLEVRHELVHRFFRTRDRDEAIAILSVFDVSWVCAFGTDRVRFPADGVLDPVFVEPGATIYRVRRPPSKASASTTSG